MSLNKIIISLSKKLNPFISPKEQVAITWMLLIILTIILFIFLIKYLYKLLVEEKLIEGNTSCTVNKKWKEDINLWCTKTNNKIHKLETVFISTDILNKIVEKVFQKNKKKLIKLQKRLGYSENDAKQAVKPSMNIFNKCADNNCPPDGNSSGTKNDFDWKIN